MSLLKRRLTIIGAAFLCIFGILQFWFLQSDYSFIHVLIGLQTFLFGYFLLNSREDGSSNPYPWYVQAFVIFSIFFPYFFHTSDWNLIERSGVAVIPMVIDQPG